MGNCPFENEWSYPMTSNIKGHTPASSQRHFFVSWDPSLKYRSKVRKIRPCEAHKNELHEVFFHTLFRYDHCFPCFFHFVEWAEKPWKDFVNPRDHPIFIPSFPHFFPIIPIYFNSYLPIHSILTKISIFSIDERKREERRNLALSWSAAQCHGIARERRGKEKKEEENGQRK